MTFGDRKTPLKRTALNRGTSQMKRTGRLKPMSKRRRAAFATEAIGWRAEMRSQPCALRAWSPCSGFTEVHEILRRSAMRDTALMKHLCVPLCSLHHAIDDNDPILAERLGIRIPRWAYDLDPEGTVAWCAATRAGLQGNYSTPYDSYFVNDRTPPWKEL